MRFHCLALTAVLFASVLLPFVGASALSSRTQETTALPPEVEKIIADATDLGPLERDYKSLECSVQQALGSRCT